MLTQQQDGVQAKARRGAVVIPTRGFNLRLTECLTSLRGQVLLEGWELDSIILVWNQGETDHLDSRQQLSEWLQTNGNLKAQIRQVYEPQRGIPFARNRGIAEVISRKLDWFAFIDDDCVAETGWLVKLTNAGAPNHVDVVAGGWSIEPVGSPSQWLPRDVFGTKHYLVKGRDAVEAEELTTAYTRNVLVKTRCLQLLPTGRPYFDPEMAQRGGSDVLFFSRLQRLGAKVVYAPEAKVRERYHGERLSLSWHLRRRVRNTQLRLSRRGETGESIRQGTRVFQTSLGLIWRLPVALVALPLSPLIGATRRFIGATALLAVPYLAVVFQILGFRYREYLESSPSRKKKSFRGPNPSLTRFFSLTSQKPSGVMGAGEVRLDVRENSLKSRGEFEQSAPSNY